jgi:PKD repeat protein
MPDSRQSSGRGAATAAGRWKIVKDFKTPSQQAQLDPAATSFFVRWLVPWLLLVAALFAGCNSTNPVEPTQSPTPSPGGGAYTVTISASVDFLPLGSTDPAVITVTAKSTATNSPAAGATCGVSTSLGSFSASGSLKVTTVTLDANGSGTVKLYPGTDSGTATLLAQVDTSISQLDLPVRESTVFIRLIEPNRGVAEGGETINIRGGGFVAPVRVTFGGVVSPRVTVRSSELVQAQSPRSPVPVDANSTVTVSIVLTSAIDKPNAPSDTLTEGFTYTSGGTPIDRPVVFALDPNTGPNEGGQAVTISGAFLPSTIANAQVTFGFSSGSLFDGLDATVQSASSTSIQVLTPRASGLGAALQNKQVDVQVRNRETGFFTISRTIYRYGDDLFLGDVQPRSASVAGGTTVTLIGRGFPAQVSVLLAGIPATVIRPAYSCTTSGGPLCVDVSSPVVTATGCTAPSGPATLTNLATGQTVTSAAIFSFTNSALQLTSVVPNVGSPNGGTLVAINGSGFVSTSTPRVTFNSVPATGVTVTSSSTLNAITPAFTGAFDTQSCTTTDGSPGQRFRSKAVDVKVTDLNSSCTDSLTGAFTYVPDTTCRPDSNPPVANFTYDTVTGQPLSIRFLNQSSGGRGTSFAWTFGDNGTSTQETPTHTYAVAGSYLVTFTISNGAGTSSISKQITVPIPFSPQPDRKRSRW